MVDSAQFVTDLTTIGDGTPHMIGYAQNAQAGYLEAPTNTQQQDGVVPLDRLPAQWWNWFLNQATRRFSEAETYIEKAVEELDGVLNVMGVSPDSTDQTQLKTMFGSTYLQNYLPKIVETATAFSPDGTHSNSLMVTDDDGNSGYSLKKVPYAPGLVVNTQIATAAKNIALPSNCPYDGQSIKVVFVGGHEAANSTDYMTLDVNNSGTPAPLVSNQNGTLDYLKIHQVTPGTYSVLQTNTALEMYYTETGFAGNPAWVVVCNPVVLSSTDYTIYADGKASSDDAVGTIKGSFSSSASYGWVICDGSTQNRADYPTLVQWAIDNSLIGSGKLFGDGNGSTTFVLPDLREVTLKGTGQSARSEFADHQTVNIGTFIADRVQNHVHTINHGHSLSQGGACVQSNKAPSFTANINPGNGLGGDLSVNGYTGNSGNNNSGRTGNTTEVKAVGVNWFIKAV